MALDNAINNFYNAKLKTRKIIIEKKHRLWPELYKGESVIAFTGCVKERASLFENKSAFIKIEEILLQELQSFKCEAYIYLFMPDHFHFILTGKDSSSNIKQCIDTFKQKSGYWLSKNLSKFKWQKDYYDHIMRNTEDLTAQILYILNNPVRAGIVDYWKQYKFKGSTIYNFDEWEL